MRETIGTFNQSINTCKSCKFLFTKSRSSAGAGVWAGVGGWGLARGAVGWSVGTLCWLRLRSRGRRGWRRRTGGRLRRWCAGSCLTSTLALGWWACGSLVGMRSPRLAVLLVLDLLEVLLAGPHLGILQLLHVKGLAVSEQLLTLVFQLWRHRNI